MIMKTKILQLFTVILFLFTISAFSLAITKNQIEIVPFAILGLVLLFTFQKKLRTKTI